MTKPLNNNNYCFCYNSLKNSQPYLRYSHCQSITCVERRMTETILREYVYNNLGYYSVEYLHVHYTY